jgi:hypothetical protein
MKYITEVIRLKDDIIKPILKESGMYLNIMVCTPSGTIVAIKA